MLKVHWHHSRPVPVSRGTTVDQSLSAARGNPSALCAVLQEALLEERKQMRRTLDEELAGEAGKAVNGAAQAPAAGEAEAGSHPAADPLDAFMSDVAVQLEQSKVRRPWLGMAPVFKWRPGTRSLEW